MNSSKTSERIGEMSKRPREETSSEEEDRKICTKLGKDPETAVIQALEENDSKRARTILSMVFYSPNTPLTKFISRSHENAVKSNERTNRVVSFECSHSMLPCEEKCKIPHETSLLV